MTEILIVLAVFMASTALVFALAFWSLIRRNRLHRSAMVKAPLHWLVSPATGAVLHRRLRSSVDLVNSTTRKDDPLAASVIDHAVRLDADLIHLRHLRRTDRRAHRAEAFARTRSVEDAAYRVAQLSRPSLPPGSDTLDELHTRLDYAEQAHAEIDAMVASSDWNSPTDRQLGSM